LVLCRFAVGRIVSLELVIALREATPSVLSSHPPSCTGGVGRSVRCGRQAPPGRPHHVRQRCLLYCQAALRLVQGGAGRSVCSCRFCVTRPWCGPGGYIQVGMRGCESSGDPRAVRSVPPFMLRSYLENFYFAIQAPSLGGERLHATTPGRRRSQSSSCVSGVWWFCPEDRRWCAWGVGCLPALPLPCLECGYLDGPGAPVEPPGRDREAWKGEIT